MAHELELDADGQASLFLADRPAWHNLGTITEGARSWEEVIELARMNWEVEKRRLQYNGENVDAWGIFRADKLGAAGFLGYVGAKYQPIQNKSAFNFVDSLLEADSGVHYESAGVLRNGERIWCMARIPCDFTVGGIDDEHKTYLLFANSHDGTMSCQVRLTTVRVVCNNTLQAAVSENGGHLRIRHTADAERKLEAARALIGTVRVSAKGLQEKLDTLAYRVIDQAAYVDALEKIYPPTPNQTFSTRRDNVILEITRLFESNDNNTFPEIRGTAFNLFNAITQHADHHRGVRVTKDREGMDIRNLRAESAMFGSGEDLKERALDVLLKATASCRTRPRPVIVDAAAVN